MKRNVYLPADWLHGPPPLWRQRWKRRARRIVYHLWCMGCLVAIGFGLAQIF